MNGSEDFSASGKSLMKMQNRRGPSIEPSGTPLLTSRTPEHVLSIPTNCFRLLESVIVSNTGTCVIDSDELFPGA